MQNHDTGSTLNHWPFPWNHLHEGYAYILTHPGTPTIFCDHYFADGLGDSIRELVKIRKHVGLHCRSKARPMAMLSCQERSRGLLFQNVRKAVFMLHLHTCQGPGAPHSGDYEAKEASALSAAQLASTPGAIVCLRCGLG